MIIHDHRTLKELQEEFNIKFPYLKIEFFKTSHEEGFSSEESNLLDPNQKVGDIRKVRTTGFMPLENQLLVSVFEQMFRRTFGLNVQVYRRSYDRWLQTWATDIWTLGEQNNRGKVLGGVSDSYYK